MLEIYFRRSGAVAIMDMCGELNIDSSLFVEKVGWCLENGYRDILCNFENVSMADFAGLSAVALAYKNVLNHKGRIKFVNVPLHIKKTFKLVWLDNVFEVYDDEKTALRSFEEDRIISEIQRKQLRRRFKRLPLEIIVELKAKDEDAFRKGKVLNISAVGILLFGDHMYPLGQTLDLRLSLKPVAEMLELEGMVVWHVDKKIQPQIFPGMGIEFHHIDPKLQEKVVEFIERNMPLDSTADSL